MMLNQYGQISFNEWMNLPKRFPNIVLDVFQIMPNHIHAIFALNSVGATLAVAQKECIGENGNGATANGNGATARVAPTIGNIVGAYKSLVAKQCLEICKWNGEKLGKFWQRNYYEHIIRNNQSYNHIADYINNNPTKWSDDTLYVE